MLPGVVRAAGEGSRRVGAGRPFGGATFVPMVPGVRFAAATPTRPATCPPQGGSGGHRAGSSGYRNARTRRLCDRSGAVRKMPDTERYRKIGPHGTHWRFAGHFLMRGWTDRPVRHADPGPGNERKGLARGRSSPHTPADGGPERRPRFAALGGRPTELPRSRDSPVGPNGLNGRTPGLPGAPAPARIRCAWSGPHTEEVVVGLVPDHRPAALFGTSPTLPIMRTSPEASCSVGVKVSSIV